MTRKPIDIVREVFGADGAALANGVDLRELPGWDSLNHMTFIAALESEYGVVLTGDEIAEMLNLAVIGRILKENHGVALSSPGDGKVLLTGGAGAIGRHLVRHLAEAGYGLIVLDRDRGALAELSRAHPEAGTYVCDLAAYEDVTETVEEVYAGGHKISVLINNAGTIHSEPLINPLKRPDPRHAPESWHAAIANNLHSVFYATASVAAKMAAARMRGLIVNVGSVAAAGNAGQSAYSAAKAAVGALTVTWSRELAPLGIRVAGVAPGFLDVPSTRRALSERHIERWTGQTPSGRLGAPEEMAHAVRFIIENDYFNGRILELDGGLRL